MKKKVAESEANFKILPPANKFINSNITNNIGVFLDNLTPSQTQHS